MIEDFNAKEYAESVEINNQIKEIEKQTTELQPKIENLRESIKRNQISLTVNNDYLKSISTIRNKIFNRKHTLGMISDTEKKIESIKKTIEEYTLELDSLEINLTEKQMKLSGLKSNPSRKNKESYLETDKDGLIVKDDRKNRGAYPEVNPAYIDENLDKVVMVHSTDLFPRNHKILTNYDGNKVSTHPIKYQGVEKECLCFNHRHTSHFVLNNRVADTGDGNSWGNQKFLIIEPLKFHVDQVVDYLNPSDTYTRGSVNLSNQAVIMVREDAYEEIPEEERQKYQIVKYHGDATQCLRNFLNLNGYDIFRTDANYPGHANSVYCTIEDNLNARDYITNYIKDNSYLSRENIELNKEEFFEMFNIYKQDSANMQSEYFFTRIAEETDISPKFLNLFINAGTVFTEQGITFKNDEEILDMFLNLRDIEYSDDFTEKVTIEEFKKVLNNNGINLEEIKELYGLYLEYEKEKSSIPNEEITYDSIKDMSLEEIYKFNNLEKCKKMLEILDNNPITQNEKEGNFYYNIEVPTKGIQSMKITVGDWINIPKEQILDLLGEDTKVFKNASNGHIFSFEIGNNEVTVESLRNQLNNVYAQMVEIAGSHIEEKDNINSNRNWDEEIDETISDVQLDEVNCATKETKTTENEKTNEENKDGNDSVEL